MADNNHTYIHGTASLDALGVLHHIIGVAYYRGRVFILDEESTLALISR